MSTISIIDVDAGSVQFEEVLELHRAAKATLGFLPDSGFTDRAARGTLLAAKHSDGPTAGYVLYDLVAETVKLRHLCVAEKYRRIGVAQNLVEEVIRRHSNRRCIELSCRRDYGLAPMWTSLGFRPVGERQGRSDAGHYLTIWQYDFGHPTLFSIAPVVGDLACMDQMILEDLAVDRPQGAHSRHLLEDWVSELVELSVTDEVFSESNDTDDPAIRQALLIAAGTYRNLSRPGAPWHEHVAAVARLAPRAGPKDHRHVARAIEGGATYFVSRDEKLLEGAESLREECGIQLLRPEGLLDRLDRERGEGRYEPAILLGTDVTDELLPAARQDEFVTALLNHGEGERAHELRGILRPALADRKHSEVRILRDANGQILGGAIREREPDRLTVRCIRVGRADALTNAVARQLVFQQRATAANEGLPQVVIKDAMASAGVVRSLVDEGFTPTEKRSWTCVVEAGIRESTDMPESASGADTAALFERNRWPVKIVGAGIPTAMISIEPAYAERLFDANLADATLFSREPALGLSRELVYYRSPRPCGAMTAPSRILWYVKGGKRGHPTGHLRAISHLAEVVCDRPRTLHNRFARLGVWDQAQVEQAARRTPDGTRRAMALRLTDTELLQNPLSLGNLRALYAEAHLKFHPPQSPIRVPEHVFCLLYRRSSRYA